MSDSIKLDAFEQSKLAARAGADRIMIIPNDVVITKATTARPYSIVHGIPGDGAKSAFVRRSCEQLDCGARVGPCRRILLLWQLVDDTRSREAT